MRFTAAGVALCAAVTGSVWPCSGCLEFAEIDFTGTGAGAAMAARASETPQAMSALVQRAATNFGRLRNAQGETLMPEGTICDSVEMSGGVMTVRFTAPEGIDFPALAADAMENAGAVLRHHFAEAADLTECRLLVRVGTEAEHRPIHEWIPSDSVETDDDSSEDAAGLRGESGPLADEPVAGNVTGQGALGIAGQPQGALSGRTVYLYGGHGWTWEQDWTPPDWRLQRGVLLNMNEDQGNLDQQNFLAYYLFNAGATVVTFRPIDYQPNAVILDNTSAGVAWSGAWSDSSNSTYYGPGSPPYRFAATSTSETATATYTPAIPAEGFYPVYTWVNFGSDRVNQLYRIRHTGGESQVRINHRRVGCGWVWLGTYHFASGSSAANGSVVISNQELSGDPGTIVVADAIRFGNGYGEDYGLDDDGDPRTLSGYLRETESTRYWIQSMIGNGLASPQTIYNNGSDDESDSWQAPPRMAARMRRDDGQGTTGDLYLGMHTNAGSGTSRGAVGLITGSPTANQAAWAALVADEVDADCTAEDGPGNWPYTWNDRVNSTFTGSYGEITNGYLGGEMDATIIEGGYHDNLEDSTLLREPRVRNVIARACYHAMVRYFNQFDSGPLAFLPEPPVRVRAANNGTGGVVVSWQPGPAGGAGGDAATSYVVYRSTNGLGFGNPATTTGTSLTINGLTANQTHHFRVAARNAGGESLPSEVLAVRVRASGASPILIVNGYDRLDRSNNVPEDLPPMAADRLRLRRNNSYDYVIQHASALASTGTWFDTCANEAVISGDVNLSSYHTVVWILGEESTVDRTFDSAEQTAVTNFLAGNGRLFLSGAEIGWDLEAQGNGLSFFQNQLRGDYVADDANVYSATGAGGTIFSGIASLSFNSPPATYDPNFPDTLQGINGSVVCLRYTGAGTPGAALQYPSGLTGGRIVLLGFPFECITSATIRNQMMSSVLAFFGTTVPIELSVFSAD